MYSKKVQFYERHLDDIICIKLRVHGRGQRKISGFPHNLAWFVSQQNLDARFGTVTHDSTQRFRCGARVLKRTASRDVRRVDRNAPDAVRAAHDLTIGGKKRESLTAYPIDMSTSLGSWIAPQSGIDRNLLFQISSLLQGNKLCYIKEAKFPWCFNGWTESAGLARIGLSSTYLYLSSNSSSRTHNHSLSNSNKNPTICHAIDV